ncbi:MAG: aspartate--tRNA(Asn) ligase [Candidatus Bathyarchaeota archaeon]|nr:aspartate--tRNA(Asn) ligase [Candidatus Bathyarchaeota archaeon]
MVLDKMGDMRRTHYAADIGPELEGQEVTVFGWVHEIRDLGGLRFLILQDRTGKLQITIHRHKVVKEVVEKAETLQKQYSIGIKGTVKKMGKAPGGAEIVPNEMRIFSVSQQPLPLDITGRTKAEIDVRLDARVLDLRREENQAIFRVQHAALQAIRSYLSEKGVMEVFTPRIIVSATEGGAALFPVAYFNREAFLAQSPQLYKEQLILDFEQVFEIGPFFRAEESHTRRHLSEFISVDLEKAFANAEDVMNVLEELIHHVCKYVKENCKRELELLGHEIVVPEVPFKRLTYAQVLEELEENKIHLNWGEDIPTPAYRILGKLHPYYYFITDWPTKAKAFYIKPKDDNPELSEGFDLMWKWVELSSGGARIHDKELLMKRLSEQGLSTESFKTHLQTFDYGMPPHAGWGLGLARFVMVLTGVKNIREVVLFPRDQVRLTP